MPAVGQSAPTFTLPSQTGEPISLDSYRGKWVVLYFYPKDMTTGCTIEAHKFQDALPQFDAKNAVILGVSVDTVDSHKQFCTKDSLTFHLLADPDHKVVSAYGSLGGFAGITMANRNTFLIDPQGKIAKEWVKVNRTANCGLGCARGASVARCPRRDSTARLGPNPVVGSSVHFEE